MKETNTSGKKRKKMPNPIASNKTNKKKKKKKPLFLSFYTFTPNIKQPPKGSPN
jgi:hypothetical protein